MNDSPLISCVMPTYGRPELVHESLAMFLAQDYEHKELLILNDCPGQEFVGEFPGVRIVNCETRFKSLGEKRNYGIAAASGEWIAVWDDDDVYLPWRLSFSMREILAYEASLYRPEEFWAYWGEPALHPNRAAPGWISHPTAIFHRDLWEAAGRYPHVTLGEDSGLFQNMHERLRTEGLTYPISEGDRFMIMRGASPYSHTSIGGGEAPPDTAPRTIPLAPRAIRDDVLRHAADSLVEARADRPPGDPAADSSDAASRDGWFESNDARTFLDDLPAEHAEVGYGSLGRHGRLGYDGGTVIVEGRRVRHALSTHAPSKTAYRLDGRYAAFETRVAVNDDAIGQPTSADFFVLVDGELKACATEVIPGEPPRTISVRVDGARELELCSRAGRREHCHAVWLRPTLRLAGSKAGPKSGSNGGPPRTVKDCLGRAEITIPDLPPGEADLCVATVASPGYESWLETLFQSLKTHGDCDGAVVAAFCYGRSPELDRVVQRYGAVRVDCERLSVMNSGAKSVLYSVGKVVPAKKYLCLDVDVLLTGSFRGVLSSLDVLPPSSVLVCRDAAEIPTLGHALRGLYGSNAESLKTWAGESAARRLDFPLVVNDGIFAATRPALEAVDELIRSLHGVVDWVDENSGINPWRNQFVFNYALAKLKAAVELNESLNWQLNNRDLELDETTGEVASSSLGAKLAAIHFNGGGRSKHAALRERFAARRPPAPRRFAGERAGLTTGPAIAPGG